MYIIKYLMCITIISNYWEVSNIGSKCIFILSVLWVLSTSLRETKARNLGHLAINSIQRKETKFEKEKKRNKARKTSSEEGRSWRHNLQIKQSGFISALRTRPLLSHTHHSTRVPRCFFYFLFFILNDLTGGWVIFYRQIKKIRVKKLGEIT